MLYRNRIGLALTVGAIGIFGQGVMVAQGTQTASMTATIVDASGKPVQDAKVIMTSPALMGQRVIMTDATGRAVARLLPPGQYKIVISKGGFVSATLNEHMGLEQTFSPRVKLTTEQSSTVEVIATNSTVDKSETKSAFNYTKEDMDGLPVARTSQLDVAYLTPGVSKNSNADKGAVEIRGAQGTGNLVLVDGQNTMDNLYVGQRLGIIMDAVEETQILVGAIPAEYGYIEGGVVNSISKTGGNEFSGSIRYDLSNPNWNATAPTQNHASVLNSTSKERSITFGGPILKDKLWFFVAGYDNHPNVPYSLDGTTANAGVYNYYQHTDEYRREAKLTWAVNETNTVTASYNNDNLAYNRNAAGAGEQAAISPFFTSGYFYSVSWRSILSEAATLSVKYGGKSQTFGANAQPAEYGAPIYNIADGNQYAAPVFDPSDPKPDLRKNNTANIKLSLFWNALGNHETDFGYDYYVGTTEASGFQSPMDTTVPNFGTVNLYQYDFESYDKVAQTVGVDNGANLEVLKYVPDKATMKTNGLYFNDKWNLDSNWVFNIGLRYDYYNASNETQGTISTSGSFSPRLGLKYDINGDSKWIMGASYSVLQGRPLETMFNRAGYVNNAIYIQYNWVGGVNGAPAKGTTSVANAENFANYSPSPNVSDAAANIKFDPHLKMQMVDEYQINLTRNFDTEIFGKGFVRLNAVSKVWKNLIDLSVGNNGTVQDKYGDTLDVNRYFNNPDCKRSYNDLDIDMATVKGPFRFSGNITWSDIEGNYVGEGKSTPGNPPALHNYDYTPTNNDGTGPLVNNYSWGLYNPTGRLVTAGSQAPLTINATAEYSLDNSFGQTVFGLAYKFQSGQHFDQTRKVNAAAVYPGIAAYGNASALSLLQYKDDQRGTGVFNSVAYLDLAVTQNFKVWKITPTRPVNAYVRMSIHNLTNHQQDMNWNTTYSNAKTLAAYNAPFHPSAAYGTTNGTSYYGDPRQVVLAAGIKF